MSGADMTVLVLSVMAVAGLGWYFFAPRKGRIAAPGDGVQKIAVTVRGGYSPELIHVRHGVPLEIEFDRQESGECTNRVAFADLGVNAGLPAYTKTTVSSPTPPACTPPMPLTVVATKGIHLGGAGTMTTTSDQ